MSFLLKTNKLRRTAFQGAVPGFSGGRMPEVRCQMLNAKVRMPEVGVMGHVPTQRASMTTVEWME